VSRPVSAYCADDRHHLCRPDVTPCACCCGHQLDEPCRTDPDCRFAKADPTHRCATAHGWPLSTWHATCAAEGRARTRDGAALIRDAEQIVARVAS